jgi:hypothetical protein
MSKWVKIENGVVDTIWELDTIPTGEEWVEVPDTAEAGDKLNTNGTVTKIVSAPTRPTSSHITKERIRRLTLGFDYDFGDERGVHRIGTTEADMLGWNEVTQASQAAIALGAGSTSFTIVTDTGPALITALEWQSILVAAHAARQPIWAAFFVLQATDPIPFNYADDSHWE